MRRCFHFDEIAITVALEVVKMTIYNAGSDESFVKIFVSLTEVHPKTIAHSSHLLLLSNGVFRVCVCIYISVSVSVSTSTSTSISISIYSLNVYVNSSGKIMRVS